jgi:WD40 repeat protein
MPQIGEARVKALVARAKTDYKMKSLLQDQFDAALAEARGRWVEFMHGCGTLDFLYTSLEHLLKAECDLSDQKADHVAALLDHLKRMREIERVNNERFRKPLWPWPLLIQEVLAPRFYRLQGEIRLEHARRDLAKQKTTTVPAAPVDRAAEDARRDVDKALADLLTNTANIGMPQTGEARIKALVAQAKADDKMKALFKDQSEKPGHPRFSLPTAVIDPPRQLSRRGRIREATHKMRALYDMRVLKHHWVTWSTSGVIVLFSLAVILHRSNAAEPNSAASRRGSLSETGSFYVTSGAPIHGLQFSPDGTRLACGDAEGTVWIYDLSNGHPHAMSKLNNPGDGAISSLTYTADGRWLLCVYTSEHIVIYDASRQKKADQIHCPGFVMAATLSPDAGQIAVGYTQAGLFQMDIAQVSVDGKVYNQRRLSTFEDWIQYMQYSPDSKLLAVDTNLARGPEIIRIWRMGPGVPEELQSIGRFNKAHARSMRFAAHKPSLAIGGYYSDARFGVEIWNVKSRQRVSQFLLPGTAFHRPFVAISPNLKLSATFHERQRVVSLWDLDADCRRTTIDVREGLVVLAFCQNSEQMAVGGEHGFVAVYRMRD